MNTFLCDSNSLCGTRNVANTSEKSVNHDTKKSFWNELNHHAFLVQCGGSAPHKDAWPDEKVPEKRFDFNEGAVHDWSEMEIPSQDGEHVTATIFSEVWRSVRVLSKVQRMRRLGGVSAAALKHTETLAESCVSGGEPRKTTNEDNDKVVTIFQQQRLHRLLINVGLTGYGLTSTIYIGTATRDFDVPFRGRKPTTTIWDFLQHPSLRQRLQPWLASKKGSARNFVTVHLYPSGVHAGRDTCPRQVWQADKLSTLLSSSQGCMFWDRILSHGPRTMSDKTSSTTRDGYTKEALRTSPCSWASLSWAPGS